MFSKSGFVVDCRAKNAKLKVMEASRPRGASFYRSAGFPTCCIADFQSAGRGKTQ
jgi:hypothetical protein